MENVIRLAPRSPAPVDLPTQERMREIADECRRLHRMAVVAGPPGIGKSELWERLRASDPRGRVYVIPCTPAQNTMGRLLRLVQLVLGDAHEWDGYMPPDRRAEAIVNRLRRLQPSGAAEPGPLLIFDEAQNVDVKSLDMMRHIWDQQLADREHACGIVWSGNPDLARSLSLKSAATFMEFKTRIARRLILKGPSRSDVTMFARRLGVSGAGCLAVLAEVAEKPGHLRLVKEVVERARRESGSEPTPQSLSAAALEMGAA
jgi:DNA transposition AAA+ family ATPase